MSTQPLMSDWLVEKIDSGEFQGLEWLDQEQKIFKVPWIHGNKLDYDKKKDTALFKEWAIYSGIQHQVFIYYTKKAYNLNNLSVTY